MPRAGYANVECVFSMCNHLEFEIVGTFFVPLQSAVNLVAGSK